MGAFVFFFGGGDFLFRRLSVPSVKDRFELALKICWGAPRGKGMLDYCFMALGFWGLSLFGESDFLGVLLFEVLWVRGSRLIAF